MSKRHLSKQQQSRIHDQQQARIHQNHHRGQVIAQYGRYVDIETDNQTVVRCNLRQSMQAIVVGDHVIWQEEHDDRGVVIATDTRHSTLVRFNTHGDKKIIAANVNQVFITLATEPNHTTLLVDSYLAAIELCDLNPIIILNKADLIDDTQATNIHTTMSFYKSLGYVVLQTSCEASEGLNELSAQLKHQTSVFVGQSGVGKSSLIKKILPDYDIAIGAISDQKKMGRHTTTTSRLYHLPSGGDVIDSPGVREFGLGKVTLAQLFSAFVEFREYQGLCKFRDCSHRHEPGCTILDAVKQEKISTTRYENFQKLAEDCHL